MGWACDCRGVKTYTLATLLNTSGLNLGGYEFSNPIRLDSWKPPQTDGVYAILVQDVGSNEGWKVLYVGQTNNFAERGFPAAHHKYVCWKKQSTGKSPYVAIYWTFGMEGWRELIESKLIFMYDPLCNEVGCPRGMLSTIGKRNLNR